MPCLRREFGVMRGGRWMLLLCGGSAGWDDENVVAVVERSVEKRCREMRAKAAADEGLKARVEEPRRRRMAMTRSRSIIHEGGADWWREAVV
jgi:hypothetical protein